MLASKRFSLSWRLILLWALSVFLLVCFRTSFGVEVTDEAFWVTEPYLLTQGAIPFVDSWSQTPLTSLLLAPLVSIYLSLTGGTEGIFLYMAYAAVLFRLVIAVAVWYFLKDGMDSRIAAVCALLLFCLAPHNCRSLDYNVLSLNLLALSGSLLCSASYQSDLSKATRRYAGGGVVMALCAIAHTLQLVNCLLFFILLLFTERRKWKNIPFFFFYALSGLSIAIFTVLYLEIVGGGKLFAGILCVLSSNYFHIPRIDFWGQLHYFIPSFAALVLRRWLPLFLLCFGALSVFLYLKKRIFFRYLPSIFSLAHTLATCGVLALGCWQRWNSNSLIMLLFFTAPLYLFAIKPIYRRASFRLLFFFWLPAFFSLLLISLASVSDVTVRYYTLFQGAMLGIPFAFRALSDSAWGPIADRVSFRQALALPCLLGALFSASMLLHYWSYVYRDDPIPQLTYRVESGVYKGCHTSPERGRAIESLETQIRSVTSADETVLVSDLLPTAYLMTQAKPCTPSSWDPCMYQYGFQDAALFLQYFHLRDTVPDKILYINGQNFPLSIDDPENEFAAFVHERYTLSEEFGEGLFSMRVFTKNPD